jgi:hypothetical protein
MSLVGTIGADPLGPYLGRLEMPRPQEKAA